MSCPVCGAEDWGGRESADGSLQMFCARCLYVEDDVPPRDLEDVDDDYDLCSEVGHDWREVFFADGVSCSECERCGAVDC